MRVTWRADRSLVAEPFASNVTALLEGIDSPAECVITCGARDPAVELAGYETWLADPTQPKFTNPANSAHCCVPAQAIDFTLVLEGKDDWTYSDPTYRAIVGAADASPHIHSLDAIGDTDHLEASNWRALRTVTA